MGEVSSGDSQASIEQDSEGNAQGRVQGWRAIGQWQTEFQRLQWQGLGIGDRREMGCSQQLHRVARGFQSMGLWAMGEARICDRRHDGACPDIVSKGVGGQVKLHTIWGI